LQDLHANLADLGLDPRSVPLVMQYNKRDLPEDELISVAELERVLNFRDVPSFTSSAVNGTGVFETLRAISSRVLGKLSSAGAAPAGSTPK
ncbi:MAG: GTPase domain-containing protein, partial [Gemmatimonadota bacterium]|nr:GTPase domain-containing protein [Gemmatimonadota bacterium]